MNQQPTFSIITITYNAERWLERTILSVLSQSYPNIEYILIDGASKDKTVEIIKLNGSVELGPMVELSDVIVDIVESGSTLKENGLAVLEEICPLSARMIVHQVSMQMQT